MNFSTISDNTGSYNAYQELRRDKKQRSVNDILVHPSTHNHIIDELTRRGAGNFAKTPDMAAKIDQKIQFHRDIYNGPNILPQAHYAILDPGVAEFYGVADIKPEYHNFRETKMLPEEMARNIIRNVINDLANEIEAINQDIAYKQSFLYENHNLLPQSGLHIYWDQRPRTNPVPEKTSSTILPICYPHNVKETEYVNDLSNFQHDRYGFQHM